MCVSNGALRPAKDGEDMTANSILPRAGLGLGAALLISASYASIAVAQTVAAAGEALPEIIVEGATLETARKSTPANTAGKGEPQSPAEKPANGKANADNNAAATSGDVAGTPTGDATAEPSSGAAPVTTETIGTAVTVVTGAQLKAQQVRTGVDALRSLPGVSVSRTGSIGGISQVRIRGAEGNHTLVLIDGIEANDTTNGEYDFSDLSVEDIERIEVIRGAQSSLYGAGAVGGVINIVTRGGKGPLKITAMGEGGAYNTREAAASVSGGNDGFWGKVSISKRETDGFNIAPKGSEEDGASLATFSAKAGARIVEGLNLDVVLRHTSKDGERDTEGAVLGQLQEQTDDPTVFDSSAWMQGATLTWDTFDGQLNQVLRATHNITHRTDTSPTTLFTTDTTGERFDYSYTGTVHLVTPGAPGFKHTLTALIENTEERFTPNSRSDDPFFPFQDDGKARVRGADSIAGEWRGDLYERLFLTAGVRYDNNDTFDDFTTWRTTASLDLRELSLRPHASAGTGVKAPTMFEQFGTIPLFFTPNANLKPEESKGWDAGVEMRLMGGLASVDVTYFNSEISNEIDGFAPGPNFTFTAVNRDGTAKHQGVEVAASVQLMPGLALSGSYTFLDAQAADGQDEIRRPDHAARADLTYTFDQGRGTLNVSAIYNGEMDDIARRVTGFSFGFPILVPERTSLDSYWLVNVAASYKLKPGLELFGRVENAFNEQYQEVYGFQTAGAAAYAGLRFTFE